MIYRFGKLEYEFGIRTYLMGVINVTPDSFSDGGKYYSEVALVNKALEDALKMKEDGADFIDVGGESTRPNSLRVSVEEELSRTVPVIEAIAAKVDIPVSIDTYKSEVADACLSAGAQIVNDISGFMFDEKMAEVTARHGASCVLMHIQGTPDNMQKDPVYENVVDDVMAYLANSVRKAEAAGIEQIFIDPGIGFGKSLEHNIELIRNLDSFRSIGYPLLIGLSRKSFIDKIHPTPVTERLYGTISAGTAAISSGADILRVHDIKESLLAAKVADRIIRNRNAEF